MSVTTLSCSTEKARQSQQLADEVAAFLAQGGQIKQLPDAAGLAQNARAIKGRKWSPDSGISKGAKTNAWAEGRGI